ncbi:MAG: hypothetical protein WC549_07585 [Actinomycetota bacterium]
MAKLELSKVQKEQLKNMVNDNKTNSEVIQFFKEKYQIDLPDWKLNYTRSRLGKKAPRAKHYKKVHIEEGAKKRKYSRKEQEPIEVESLEQTSADIKKGLDIIVGGNKALFMHFRLLVIKEAGKVIKACKAAGIDYPPENQ